MRHLAKTTALFLIVCLAVTTQAFAARPTVGGPKAASLSFAFTTTGPQQHFAAEADSSVPAAVDSSAADTCVAPRCYAFPFTLVGATKKAKSADLSSQITWSSATSRFWLKVMDVTKDPTVVAECYTFITSAGPSATVTAHLPVARKYAIWVTVEQLLGVTETVKGVVHSPAKDVPPSSPISGADKTGQFLNSCEG